MKDGIPLFYVANSPKPVPAVADRKMRSNMFLLKLLMKVLLLPVMLVLFVLRVLVKIGIELSSVIVGGLILIILGCIIYVIVQQMWPSMWILIAMVAVLIMVTAGAGILDVLLEEASINLGLLMQS
ncbi:hypothetical protein SAMN02910262_01074 [[Clostridium] aminophilum]|uniref:Uncharacterized protein n=2 Tax=[Clostridium] aminophilum TaxID=1526 RepID=A0A1I6J0F4_9FIRM|nr:hypothetical protein SAMN02910262_01074 [[Clostridium] aminophilum]